MKSDRRSHGLWAASSPAAPATPALTNAAKADVVIVGGGYTGCSAALHLAVSGKKAVVLEAAEIGFGGSGRNVGLVNAGLWVMPDELLRRLGELRGERLLDQLGHAPRLVFDLVDRYGIECQAKRAGTLHCAVGARGHKEVAERARQWRARGADVELLEGKTAQERIGSTVYSAALLDRRAGTIQPLAYVRGLARAAIGAGAEIHSRSPVTRIEDLGDRWAVHTPGGSVTAPWVIAGTEAYSTGIWSRLREEQVMLPYFNLATRPIDPEVRKTILSHGEGAWDTPQVLSSFRFDDENRLVFGSVGALRGTGAAIHPAWAKREIARRFPQLDRVEFEHAWYGNIGMTDEAMPRLHRLDRNIVSISAYNGRGIAPGTTFGRDLARLATGEVDADDLSLPVTDVRRARLRAIRTAFYEVGAQALHFAGARL